MATTTNYSFTKPTVGGDQDTWGTSLNANWDAIDTLLGGTDATEFAILNGATVTTAELNVLDGITATTAEINVLDGITATVTELNYTDGLTGNIQAQIDALDSGKQSVDATLTAYAGTLTAAGKIPYATSVDVAGELDFKDEDDMASNSATAVPSQQSVKAYVDAQAYTQPTALGAVGTYAWLGINGQVTFNAGQFVAGSSMVYAGFLSASGFNDNTAADLLGGSSPSGTWRAMGEANSATNRAPSTLFLRIA
jgi:hypothetical protein